MLRKPNKSIRWLLAAVVLMSVHATAYAQATRTWVSGVGDDANPCSRTAPCKTFAGTIAKTAAGGEIDTLDPGSFGTVTITKSITIQSDGSKNGGILASGVNGIVVNAGPNDIIIISGLNLNGVGSSAASAGLAGIQFYGGAALHVENCHIRGFSDATSGNGINFAPSTGVSHLYVRDSTFDNNGNASGGAGIKIAPTGTGSVIAEINNSEISHSKGYGIYVSDNGFATIHNSNISGSYLSGIAAFGVGTYSDIGVDGSMISDDGRQGTANDGAILASGLYAYVHLSNNVITENEYGFRRLSSGKINTFGNNRVYSNTADGTTSATETQK